MLVLNNEIIMAWITYVFITKNAFLVRGTYTRCDLNVFTPGLLMHRDAFTKSFIITLGICKEDANMQMIMKDENKSYLFTISLSNDNILVWVNSLFNIKNPFAVTN